LDIALYPATPARAAPERRILIVEDEAFIGFHLQEIVESLGCAAVGPAGDLATALEMAAGAVIDAALLDVNLGNGEYSYPVARLLQNRGIPFALVTAYSRRALGAFADCAIVSKPFRPPEIKACLRELLTPRGVPAGA
jgi:CheY-like chemotaxis protein